MKKFAKILTTLLLTAAGALLIAGRAAAESPKPALTIAFAGFDQLTSDVKLIDKIDARLGLSTKLDAALGAATKGKKLAGLDKSRPWGVMVCVGETDEPSVRGYLPVTDLKQLMAGLPSPNGESLTPNDKGIYEIPASGKTLYAKQKGKWAVITDSEDSLDTVPADPTESISELTKKYLISVRGNVQNVPEARRNQVLAALRGLVQFSLAAQGGSSEQQAMQQASVKQMFDGLDKLSKELDTLVIGLGIDKETKALYLDVEACAVPGSQMAAQCAAMKDAKTNFAGFKIPGAAMTMLSAGTIDDAEVAQSKQMLESLKGTITKQLEDNDELSDKRKEVGKQLLSDAFDVLQKTVELKRKDGGMAIVLQDGPAVVAGSLIAEGNKLDATFKKLIKELSSEKPELSEYLKLNADSYEGIKFHIAKIPVPSPEAREVFGDSVQIILGLSDSRLYIGAGKDPLAVLKKAINASKESPDTPISPVEMVISAEPIAKFFAKSIPDTNPGDAQAKKVAGKIAEQLGKMQGKDHVTMTVKPITNGQTMRLSFDPGVTKSLMHLFGVATHAWENDSSDEN